MSKPDSTKHSCDATATPHVFCDSENYRPCKLERDLNAANLQLGRIKEAERYLCEELAKANAEAETPRTDAAAARATRGEATTALHRECLKMEKELNAANAKLERYRVALTEIAAGRSAFGVASVIASEALADDHS